MFLHQLKAPVGKLLLPGILAHHQLPIEVYAHGLQGMNTRKEWKRVRRLNLFVGACLYSLYTSWSKNTNERRETASAEQLQPAVSTLSPLCPPQNSMVAQVFNTSTGKQGRQSSVSSGPA